MAVTVRFPVGMRLVAGAPERLDVRPGTVQSVLDQALGECPGLGERVLRPDGTVNRFVNVYVGGDDIRALDGLATPVPDGSVVTLLSAVSGG